MIGRDWPLEGVALAGVDDLETFFAGRPERTEVLFDQGSNRSEPEAWELPAAEEVDAHVELARSSCAHLRAGRAAMTEGRGLPPLQEGEPQRWERATRAQMSLTGQGRDEATDAVHSMVDPGLVALVGLPPHPNRASRAPPVRAGRPDNGSRSSRVRPVVFRDEPAQR